MNTPKKRYSRITVTLSGDTSNIVRILGKIWGLGSAKTIDNAMKIAGMYYLGTGNGSEAEKECVGPIHIQDKRKAKEILKDYK